ncbi:hydrolase [Anaerobacillus sp. MEB173]|uniref:hydrolase n=1 Tax=Anaerobacillus sp. MEB173 TaxID=3383345 RepID=UPI003F919B64
MRLDKEKAALVVVDVQGKLAHMVYEQEILFENIRKLILGSKLFNMPIIWVEQYPEGLGSTVQEIAELLEGMEPIKKMTFSSCGSEEFCEKLSKINRNQLLVVGIEAHVCVYQTVMDLLQLNYHVELITDGVSSRTYENKKTAIDRLKAAGANLTSTELALFDLMKTAEGPTFKEMLKIVK